MYYHTVASAQPISSKLVENKVLAETKAIWQAFTEEYRERIDLAYLYALFIDRIAFADNHPIKLILNEAGTIDIFNPEMTIINLDDPTTPFFEDLSKKSLGASLLSIYRLNRFQKIAFRLLKKMNDVL